MDTTELLDPSASSWEPAPLGRVPYAGCLSIGILGHVIVCAMPLFIKPDEIARPWSRVPALEFTWRDDPWSRLPAFEFTWRNDREEELSLVDYEPPLLAAGRFTTVARRGMLPPLEWDG